MYQRVNVFSQLMMLFALVMEEGLIWCLFAISKRQVFFFHFYAKCFLPGELVQLQKKNWLIENNNYKDGFCRRTQRYVVECSLRQLKKVYSTQG